LTGCLRTALVRGAAWLPMRKVLITGFEPFGGAGDNPSQEVARALEGTNVAGRRLVGAVLPCVFGESIDVLNRLLRMHRPELVVCLGVAGDRAEITPERIAINLNDAAIPDNAGRQPIDTPVLRGGPAAYWSRLPVKAIVAALRERGIPAVVSQTAGTFVCNHVFYGLMHALRNRRRVRGGFIHLPVAAEHAAGAIRSLPLQRMIEGVALAIEVTLRTRRDLRVTGGRTD
jgi:pyroglutamyl-peptidase